MLEVRRLTDSGHQTAIITTARSLTLDKQVTLLPTRLSQHQAQLGAAAPPDPDDGRAVECRAAVLKTIQ